MLSSSTKRRGRGLELLLAIGAAFAAGGAGGYLIASRGGSASSQEPAVARAERITALGRLQPAGGVIPVYGPPGDRITTLYRDIKPGAKLEADKSPIADLASAPDRLLEVQIAEKQQQEAKDALTAAQHAGEQRIRAATAELDQAKANKASDLAAIDAKLTYLNTQLKTANTNVARLKKLRKDGVNVADEDIEKAELLAAQANAELKASEALRTKTVTTYEESEKAAVAKIAAAEAELKEAKAKVPTESTALKLKLARQLAEKTTIRAPISGTVLKVIGRDGQPTGIDPIIQMGDLTTMTAIAEVYESDVGRLTEWVTKGPVKAEVKNPALPRSLSGVVNSRDDISKMIARNQVFAMGPREDADRRVVEVVVHLEPDATADAGRLVGLQVTVTLGPNK
jgi:HlyD family secretion protein